MSHVHKPISKTLHVIAVRFSVARYDRPVRLFNDFVQSMENNPAVTLWVGESVIGERNHTVVDPNNPRHFKFYSKSPIWSKESIINAVLQRIPRGDAEREQYIAWVDADVQFSRPDWAEETIQQLQHFDIVQPWRSMQDLGPNHEIIGSAISAGYAHQHGLPYNNDNRNPYGGPFWHPGFAWAARRSALDTLGGLLDWSALGAGDHLMMLGLLGKISDGYPQTVSPGYQQAAARWQRNALKLQERFGYVDAHLLHYFHGKKKQRYYIERWDVLERHQYDPYTDVVRNSEGLVELNGDKPKLAADMLRYFLSRNEDSIDL